MRNDHNDIAMHDPQWVFLRQEREYDTTFHYDVWDVFFCQKCLEYTRHPGKEPVLQLLQTQR